MGLSSSQARLLSITARLTDNEYKSQRLTNAKMKLANLGLDAQKDYADTLNAQKLEYTNYNSASKLTREDLTPAIIYEYQPYKNQYSMINTAGQILVSRVDAQNYKETNNLQEFLDRYGLLEEVETTYHREEEYEVMVHNPQYDVDWENYYNNKPAEKILDYTDPAWDERIHSSQLYQVALTTGCMSGSLRKTN